MDLTHLRILHDQTVSKVHGKGGGSCLLPNVNLYVWVVSDIQILVAYSQGISK